METSLKTLERRLKDEQDTLQRLLDKREELDLLIKHQQENIWKVEEMLEEEKYLNFNNNVNNLKMQTKFKIIETKDYILAVSDEEIAESYYVINNLDNLIGRAIRKLNDGEIKDKEYSKIIAYQPKGSAPELDLPLLPKINVEDDDVENLVKEYVQELIDCKSVKESERTWVNAICHQILIKAATKVYSEEDLRKAIELTILNCIVDTIGYDNHVVSFEGNIDEIIQSLKQLKTPKWFVAETEDIFHSPSPIGMSVDTILKITTINGKTYCVGHYLCD